MKRIALALLLIAAAPASSPVLRAEGWTAPSPSRAMALSSAPAECLAHTDDAIETGRALFRSAVLFGGPAARVGLSCEACHAGGRVNSHFLLAELGDRPGEVDVTSEWASKTRGDSIRNPVPIPDLAGTGTRASFGGKRVASLDAFVRDVIVEEFQGQPPPDAALAGLIAYIRALDPATCRAGQEPITLTDAADDVRRALAAAVRQSQRRDMATASLLLYAAQDSVARIVERLPPGAFAPERSALTQLARELGALRSEPHRFAEAAPAWSARFAGVVGRLSRRESRTYFNPRRLARAMTERR